MIVPPGLDDLRRRRHPLDRLIEILIERVPGVARQDDVERRGDFAHRRLLGIRARSPVLGQQLAGEHRRDLLLTIECHVDREVDADHSRDLTHVVVDRVALGDAPGGARMTDALRVVQRHHGLETRKPGRDHLGAPAEPGEEMRLDEAGGDPNVGVQKLPVQMHGDTGGRASDIRQRRRVTGVVVDHAVAVEDVAAEHPLELGRRVRAVGSRGNQDRDVFRSDLRHLFEERPQHLSTRLGAGDVAYGNGHALALTHELAQAARTESETGWPLAARPADRQPPAGRPVR